MKDFNLINMLEHELLNQLRYKMGASLINSFSGSAITKSLDHDFIHRLGTEGIEIESLDDVASLKDNTISFNNKRVILYIRDVVFNEYRSKSDLPKFHISFCKTLEDMKQKKRFEKYIVSNQENKNFIINKISSNGVQTSNEKLDVCRNCLDKIQWKGYSSGMVALYRNQIVNEFDLKEFFKQYPKS